MKRSLILILFSLTLLISSPQTDIDQANLLYEQGDYEKAADVYESIIEKGYENGELYYNLGNAYYKSGDRVKAVVNYERALEFMPGDEDLEQNLNMVRLSFVDKAETSSEIPLIPLIGKIRNSFNVYSGQKAFFFFMVLSSVLFSIYLFIKNGLLKKSVFYLTLISFFMFLIISFIYYDIYNETRREFGIISTDKIPVMSSPDDNINSKELFFLHRGAKAEIIRSNDEWFEIKLDDKKIGWIKRSEMIRI